MAQYAVHVILKGVNCFVWFSEFSSSLFSVLSCMKQVLEKLRSQALLQPVTIMGDQGRSGHVTSNTQMDFILNTVRMGSVCWGRGGGFMGRLSVTRCSLLTVKAGTTWIYFSKRPLSDSFSSFLFVCFFVCSLNFVEIMSRRRRKPSSMQPPVCRSTWGG